MRKKNLFAVSLILLLALIFVYSNHFNNSFHFDDSHAVVNNIYIHSIKNIPLFFQDGATFSSLPANQSYRPVITTSLAIDYWLGGGLNPFYFHLSQFIFFVLQGILMFFLFQKIFSLAFPHKWNSAIALFASAWYLFHPANAETINYIIARTDSISTFFVVLAFVMYIYSGVSRKYFLYLLPLGLGVLAKEPAVMFAPLLFIYIALFHKKISFTDFSGNNVSKLFSSFIASLPAFIFCAAVFVFQQKMQPETWVSGGTSRWLYIITQPYVILHYFTTFFFPLSLSADTDWATFNSITESKAIFGILFVMVLLFIAFRTSRKEKTRPISFGIFWFFIALIPSSSIIPLSEVMNDHRIFFPYIGLAISVCWAFFLFLNFIKKKFPSEKIVAGISFSFCFILLSLYAYGTHERNKVWRTDETLWKDVTEKSPKNARGLMNYGLVLMAKADYPNAEKYFTDALKIWPYYAYLHINMGVLKNATGNPIEAEKYFKNAVTYRKDLPESFYYYANFLHARKRDAEAITMLNKTLELSQAHTLARYQLMAIYFDNAQFEKLNQLANETLVILPNDAQALYYLNAVKGKKSKLDVVIDIANNNPSPENYLNLSLEYYYAGQYENCIHASEEALKLKPDYDLAYNNICSAYNMMKNWDKAVVAGERAVELNPNNQLAKNNLAWAKSQQKK